MLFDGNEVQLLVEEFGAPTKPRFGKLFSWDKHRAIRPEISCVG
jgi:hypothetical protein